MSNWIKKEIGKILLEIAKDRNILIKNADQYMKKLGSDEANIEAIKRLSRENFYMTSLKTNFRMPTIIEIQQKANEIKYQSHLDDQVNYLKMDVTEGKRSEKVRSNFTFANDIWQYFGINPAFSTKFKTPDHYFELRKKAKENDTDIKLVLGKYLVKEYGNEWQNNCIRN